jgi:hypothetical protein
MKELLLGIFNLVRGSSPCFMAYSRGLQNEEEFKEKALRTWCETQALKLRRKTSMNIVG